MLGPAYLIQLKNPNGPLRVLMLGRISTEHKSLENIEASYEFARRFLEQIYKGPVQIKQLGERGSGMLKDRESIREAEDDIETGTWDLMILEDLARAYRYTQYQIGFVQHCVDHDTRLISIGMHSTRQTRIGKPSCMCLSCGKPCTYPTPSAVHR